MASRNITVTLSINADLIRQEFLRLLTEDGPTSDRRRRDYNQAIFAPESEGGHAIWSRTDLGMVMDTFDQAVRNLRRPPDP